MVVPIDQKFQFGIVKIVLKKLFRYFLFLFVAWMLITPAHSFASAPPRPSLSDAIYADLAVNHYLDNVSVFYTDGKAINDIKLNETKHWLPASTVKTFSAMYAYKLIKEKKINLNDFITIDAKNNVPTELVTGDLPTLYEGESVTIDRLIRQMITQSDNTSYNQLIDVLGRDNITRYIQSIGLTHSHVGSKLNLDTSQTQYEYDAPGYGINTTTAEDYAKAFMLIKNNKIPGAKELYAVLKAQKINTMIPLYLPKTVICAHKTGDLDPLYHDGGICQDKKRSYILTIFTNAGDPNLVAHLSELIYSKNFALVGKSSNTAMNNVNGEHPLDPLVLNTQNRSVLGTSTINFPTPDITASDLGVSAKDLSLVIKNNDLPSVIIPADSPLHFLSDAWLITKKVVALSANARHEVDLETGKLRLAEAKDLIRRGKAQEAQGIFQGIQRVLTTVANDKATVHDSSAQNTLQAISETRFAVLGDELAQTKGEDRLSVIKEIADQAKATMQTVQPNLPDAINAANPAQKPLIGEIVSTDSNTVTVRTAGGIEVSIPVTNTAPIIQEKQNAISPSPIPSEGILPSTNPTPSPPPSLHSLAVGTTVALIGSTTNNTFAPTLVLANVPKELAAPEPVKVAKIDTKHNTMVVVENGIYTQVNINKNTIIKGSDTNIPLKEIAPGDVVVVHGELLVPVQTLTPSHISSPTVSITPTIKSSTISNNAVSKEPTPSQSNTTLFPSPTTTVTPHILQNSTISPTVVHSPLPTLTNQKKQTSILSPVPTPQPSNTSQGTQPKPTVIQGTSIQPNTSQGNQPKPTVIQGTSIQLIEKKGDIKNTITPVNSQPPQTQQQTQQPPHEQPKSQPQPTTPILITGDEKKK